MHIGSIFPLYPKASFFTRASSFFSLVSLCLCFYWLLFVTNPAVFLFILSSLSAIARHFDGSARLSPRKEARQQRFFCYSMM
jgi:hypothetical protein